MAERPILMSAPMVRAILDGKKSQTRRVVKPQPSDATTRFWHVEYSTEPKRVGCFVPRSGGIDGIGEDTGPLARCPYGQPGDRLWVRETHTLLADPLGITPGVNYEADDETRWNVSMPDGLVVYNAANREAWKRRPSIFMIRAHSRLTLEITGVWVERVQDISPADAQSEGVTYSETSLVTAAPWTPASLVERYGVLWDSLNGSRGYGWDVNPWVWAIEFRRVEVPRG